MIVIELLSGGLGNRMRALDSAISLSKRIDKPLYMVWNKDPSLNCNFNDLFVTPKTIKGIKQRDVRKRAKRFFRIIFKALPSLYYFDIKE